MQIRVHSCPFAVRIVSPLTSHLKKVASLLAQNISKTYVRAPVLQDVTLSVGAASVHCLAGENGSGKSTLIKIISGTLSTDAGKVIIDGHDATHENALKRIGLGLSVIY